MVGQGYMWCIWVGMVLSKLIPCRHLSWILCPVYMDVAFANSYLDATVGESQSLTITTKFWAGPAVVF